MKHYRRVVCFLVTLLSITAASDSASAQTPRPSTPVEIVNTDAHPVPTRAADVTETVISQFIDVTDAFFGNHFVGNIDVSAYKSVRVVIERGSCGPCSDPVRVQVRTSTTSSPSPFLLDSFALTETQDGESDFFATRVYDVPGDRLSLSFANPTPGGSNSVRFVVFGRRN